MNPLDNHLRTMAEEHIKEINKLLEVKEVMVHNHKIYCKVMEDAVKALDLAIQNKTVALHSLKNTFEVKKVETVKESEIIEIKEDKEVNGKAIVEKT